MNKVDDRTGQDDDALAGETGQPSAIILSDAADHVHQLPEQLLRSRVRGWLELQESPELAFWVGCYTPEGRWIYCSSDSDLWAPKQFRQAYAMAVCRHINKHCSNGGAWLVGWIRGGREFYMLWKDPDGDLQIPIECDKPFTELKKYTLSDWEKHCSSAHLVYSEHKRNLEMTESQQVKRAQGERTSPQHLDAAPAIGLPS